MPLTLMDAAKKRNRKQCKKSQPFPSLCSPVHTPIRSRLDLEGLSEADLTLAAVLAEARKDKQAEENQHRHDTAARGVDRRGGCASNGEVAAAAARARPLPVVLDLVVLGAVDELGERDVAIVAEDVERLEVTVRGTVLELEAEVVTRVGVRAPAELDREGGRKVG